MKLGLGIYAGMATEDNLQFARQIGATHIVQHLPGEETLPSTKDGYWSYEELQGLVDLVEAAGLKLEA
ncbi:MAG: D-mannonate dehydratase, partial [Candidatus Poribacteria bacterium]